jgi:hypothetical protein
MTPNLLDELEKIVALSEKATGSPWDCGLDGHGGVSLYTDDSEPLQIAFLRASRRNTAKYIVALHNFLRTHAPALADMAKRMEAAERDAGKCWALHFKGPDDVVAVPSREAAEIAARNFNAFWDAHKHQRAHDVRAVAEVIEWEHGAIEHAKSAAEHWPEYAALLTAAIDATQEGEAG